MNPIKTTREMLFELAQLPHMAGGRQVAQAGSEMMKLIDDAIQKYVRIYKKPPPPEDVAALKAHAEAISQKPTIWSDSVTQARARHQLATDPNLINPDVARDQFLTQATTGRTVKGTNLQPQTLDITDPNVLKAVDAEQGSGQLGFAEIAKGLENQALSEGKIPLIDKLKANFFAKNKRFPTDEELDAIIASYNPMRHQYGSTGTSIVQSRPPTAKGMQQWKERARLEGMPESYLEKSPADYRKHLLDELDIGRGVQPTTPVSPEGMADGRSTNRLSPRDMEAELALSKAKPSFLKRMGKKAMTTVLPGAGMALSGIETASGAEELGRRLAKGDTLGSVNKAISTTGSAIGTLPFVGWLPGLGLYALGEGLDYLREPQQGSDYRSLMEDYK